MMSTFAAAANRRAGRRPDMDKNSSADSAGLQLSGIAKVLGGRTIVDHLDLAVAKGELICLLGPSGCGKTTTLRIIGGFLQPDAGRLHIDGVDHTYSKPERRPTAMVFQNYALWPHMSVSKNIAFGLKVRKMSSTQIKEKIDWALDLLGLQHHKDSMPSRISGGEQQRVALARALVLEPEVLLMDEPLSNLDAKLRVQVRETIREIQQRLGITTVFVTHDQEEALSIADRVAVMSGGRIEQLAPPAELYRLPRTKFVAGFVGTMNVFDSAPVNGSIPLADGGSLPCASFSGRRGDSCWVRPEDIQITDAGAPGTGRAVVLRVIPRGHYREVLLQSHGTALRVVLRRGPAARAGGRSAGDQGARLLRRPAGGGRHNGCHKTGVGRRPLPRCHPGCGRSRRGPIGVTVMSIAHRGDPVQHRENTIESVTAAIDAGAGMVEIDVRVTRDGALMILHDADLTRLWNVPHPLADLDLAEVRELTSPSGERIPTLADIARLAAERGCQLMVDLPDPAVGPAAFDELQRLGVLDAMLFAGNTGPLRAHAPTARIALSWERLALPSDALLRERQA